MTHFLAFLGACLLYNYTRYGDHTGYLMCYMGSKTFDFAPSFQEFLLGCDRCSVVFSSGHLINSSMGHEIDEADCVIRQNTATVNNYTKDVGMRTTIRVIGHINLLEDLQHSDSAQMEIFSDPQTKASFIYVPWLYDVDFNTKNKTYEAARKIAEKFPDVYFIFQGSHGVENTDKKFLTETGLNR